MMAFSEIKNPDFLTPEEINALQLERLKQHLRHVLSNSPYYRTRISSLSVDDIQSLADLSKLPLTSKKDLARHNPDFLAVPAHSTAEYVTTSGTTGRPVKIALGKKDLDRLAYNEARSLTIAGFSSLDVVQLLTTLDKCFMAGMAYYSGLQALGATAVRVGNGSPEFQWEMIREMDPTALIVVPSFLHKLGAYPSSKSNLRLQKALCIGEPLRNSDFSDNQLAKNIKQYWDLDLRSTYASTEMATAFTECEAKKGGHLIPELILVEILDPHGNPVAEGELGEVTVTPLGVEAMPLLRFRTGDLARMYYSPCICGRNTPRLGPVEGRLSQMIKLKGTTLFPAQIEETLHQFPDISPYVIELSLDHAGMDSVAIYIPETLPQERLMDLTVALQAGLRVTPLLRPGSIETITQMLFQGNSRKPKKIIDVRYA